jgi:hypothetical protein
MFNLRKLAVCASALSIYPAAYAGESATFANEISQELVPKADPTKPALSRGVKIAAVTATAVAMKALFIAGVCVWCAKKNDVDTVQPQLTPEQRLESKRRKAFVDTLNAGYFPWGALHFDITRQFMIGYYIKRKLSDNQSALLMAHTVDMNPTGTSYTMHFGNSNRKDQFDELNGSVGSIVLRPNDPAKPSLYIEAGYELDNRTWLPPTWEITSEKTSCLVDSLIFKHYKSLEVAMRDKALHMVEDILRGQKLPEEIYDTYKPISFYGTKNGLG